MNNRFSLLLIAIAIAVSSCGKKSEDMTPVQPGETVTFKDQVYKFTFKAPKAWIAESTPGQRTSYYSSQGSEVRFQKFTEGDYGAKIEVGVKDPADPKQTLDEFKKNFILEGATFTGPDQTTLGGQPAWKIGFSAGAGDEAYVGYRIYTNKDSVVTYFEASTFGKDRMNKYKAVFDLAEKSVTPGYVLKFIPGKIDSAMMEQLKKEAAPSPSLSNYNGNGYSIEYPDNFNPTATGKGIKFEGDWKGATIMVDVIPSNGADLNTFAAAAAKTYGGISPSNTTLNGEAAKMINYSVSSSYGSRAYIIVKGANAYRITINWPKEVESLFRPAMEKSAQSFKLK
ncbi:MAG TPA: hypothetical protein VFO76_08035 [Candidatus Kapabacteria bacterium]|nr:hypothetical protein [Candidatus Kapabacteria bacterium]